MAWGRWARLPITQWVRRLRARTPDSAGRGPGVGGGSFGVIVGVPCRVSNAGNGGRRLDAKGGRVIDCQGAAPGWRTAPGRRGRCVAASTWGRGGIWVSRVVAGTGGRGACCGGHDIESLSSAEY